MGGEGRGESDVLLFLAGDGFLDFGGHGVLLLLRRSVVEIVMVTWVAMGVVSSITAINEQLS